MSIMVKKKKQFMLIIGPNASFNHLLLAILPIR